MGTAMHLEVQLTSPSSQAARHLAIAACWEVSAGVALAVVDWALAKAARAPVRKRVVKRIVMCCVVDIKIKVNLLS